MKKCVLVLVHNINKQIFLTYLTLYNVRPLFEKSFFHEHKFQYSYAIPNDWLNLNTKCNTPFGNKCSPLSKRLRRFCWFFLCKSLQPLQAHTIHNQGLKVWQKWEIYDNFWKPQATGNLYKLEIYPGALIVRSRFADEKRGWISRLFSLMV